MNFEKAQFHLKNNAGIIRSLVEKLNQELAGWKPDSASWSALEVINHLYDEEREDFREHLDWILHRSDEPWSSIDPQGWISERKYNQRDFQESLELFLQERKTSLQWLGGLKNTNWQKSGKAPWGFISAGEMLAAWVAHDILHMRQLVELKWVLIKQDMEPYSVDYAGEW